MRISRRAKLDAEHRAAKLLAEYNESEALLARLHDAVCGPTTQQRLADLGRELGELVAEKNAAYGSSFEKCGAFLRLLYPAGVATDQYADALLLVRIFDKCMRIATRKDTFGESPYRDLAGYGLCGAAMDEARQK